MGWFIAVFAILLLWFGGLAVIKHYVRRGILRATGQTPWNLARFLEQASAPNFMQKVGNAYIFVHRHLLKYLAVPGRR